MNAKKDIEGLTKAINFEGKINFKFRKFALVEFGHFKAASISKLIAEFRLLLWRIVFN